MRLPDESDSDPASHDSLGERYPEDVPLGDVDLDDDEQREAYDDEDEEEDLEDVDEDRGRDLAYFLDEEDDRY